MDGPAQPLACSLDGTDLAARLDAWREVLARATTRHVEDGRVVASYPNEPELHERLRELIALEHECCSFLHFDIEERADAIVTDLRLPEDLGGETRIPVLEVFGRP